MLALGCGPAALPVLARAGASAPAPAPISAVAADGWQATMVAPAELALSPVSVSRQGFDATGAATTIVEQLATTKRVRQPYPNHAVLTADQVALSDFVYATDTIAGVTNNSAVASPKPIANWVSTARELVGNTVTPEIVAAHRNGIACVIFRATDGSTTVTATCTAPVVSGRAGDRNAVLVWRAALDLSTLTDNADITVNAKVYPRIGKNSDASCIRDSADLSNIWQFSPRTYRKNTSRAANPPIVYVATGGDDTNGSVSTSDATASGNPCATLTGAINRARTVLGTTAGSLDGLRVRLTSGTWSRASSPTSNTVNAAIVIEPGTGVSKASAVMEFGAANNTFACTYVKHRGLTLRRQGAFYLHNTAGNHCIVEDCDLDLNGNNGALAGSATVFFFNGVAISGLGASTIAAGSVITALLRGCSFGAANATFSVEPNLVVGCDIRGCRLASNARDISGGIVAFNTVLQAGQGSGPVLSVNQATAIDGFAVVQNVIEFTHSAANTILAASNDGQPENISHLVCWHNSFAGFDSYGRSNILYNESSGTTRRTHTLASFVGNIHVQINSKQDVFHGTYNDALEAPNRTGGWPYAFGVGVRGEFGRYKDAGGTGFGQDYPGIGASIGTGNTGAGNDPKFTDYKATTTGGAAGAGLGTYTLQAGSPALALVAASPLPFDLAGNARSGTVAAGAFV